MQRELIQYPLHLASLTVDAAGYLGLTMPTPLQTSGSVYSLSVGSDEPLKGRCVAEVFE